MPEITIVDTSSLFYFYRVGLFELFNKLYGHITVPEAVKNELKKLLDLDFRLKPELVKEILTLAGEE